MQYLTEQLNKVDILLADGDYLKAVNILEEILCEEPDHKEAIWRIGIAFTEMNEQKKSLEGS